MAWGHIPRPTRAHYRPDYHSAERHAATKTYSHYTRGQIASGALGPGTAAAQAAAHKWFSHTAWQNHRNAVVAAHKKARVAERKQKADFVRALGISADIFGQESAANAFKSPLETLMQAYENRTKALEKLNPGTDAARRASIAKQRDLLWKIVHGAYGGKKPGIKVGVHLPMSAGEVWGGHRNVAHISNYLAEIAQAANPKARAELARVLMHEWAHTRQSPSTYMNRVRAEGGATAYAQRVSRKYGYGPVRDTTPQYADFARAVRQQLGPEWIRKGQFK